MPRHIYVLIQKRTLYRACIKKDASTLVRIALLITLFLLFSYPALADSEIGIGFTHTGGSPQIILNAPSTQKGGNAAQKNRIDRIVKSVWFAFLSGLASILGMFFTLYQLRVRHTTRSKYRTVEWQKALIIATGTGLSIFAGITFYAQTPPPSLHSFRKIYDSLHGVCESRWVDGIYSFNEAQQVPDYTLTITNIYFSNEMTRVSFQALCRTASSCSLFRYPRLSIGSGDEYAPIARNIHSNGKRVYGSLDFPRLSGECGTLIFKEDVFEFLIKDKNGNFPFSTSFYLSADDRGDGTSAWGFLSIAGLVVFMAGILYNPSYTINRRLLREVKFLRNEQDAELDHILLGRSYEELSAAEKHKYDDIRAYYARSINTIFETLSAAKLPDNDDHKRVS